MCYHDHVTLNGRSLRSLGLGYDLPRDYNPYMVDYRYGVYPAPDLLQKSQSLHIQVVYMYMTLITLESTSGYLVYSSTCECTLNVHTCTINFSLAAGEICM